MSTIPSVSGGNFTPPIQRPGGQLQQTRAAVDFQINLESTRTLTRELNSPATATQPDPLASMDPKLAQDYRALLQFLSQQDPEAAKSLEAVLRETSQGIRAGGQTPLSANQLQSALQITVTQLSAEVSDGQASLSAEQIRVTFSQSVQQVTGLADPLVFDLNDNGFETTTAEQGHTFDLVGNGQAVRAATATGGDALLVFDRNQNGFIDSGKEFFGDQNGAVDGFAELARYDLNQDQQIDADDSIFTQLRLFQDANRNGFSETDELKSLADYRIASISLKARQASGDSSGNPIASIASFTREDGSQGAVGDLLFNYIS